MSIEHWLQFATFAEQDHFIYPKKDSYSGVLINANMVAHAPAGLAAFLLGKVNPSTKYIVDPLTHAYQHDPSLISKSDGEPKSSIKGLADIYGEPITSILGNRPLLPDDFKDPKTLEAFTENVINFQLQYLCDFMKNTDVAKYLDDDETSKRPYAVISPYFYITESSVDEWLPINRDAIRISRRVLKDNTSTKLFAAVVLSQGIILDKSERKKIIATLTDNDVDGYLVWIDSLDEQKASSAELKGLLELAKSLRHNNDREVINVHGGYFSILAAGNLGGGRFSGVTHGPEFGEYRGVVPVGGGIPIARYYIPDLHARVRYGDAIQIFTSEGWLGSADAFHSNVCNCQECKEVIEDNPDNFRKFGEGTIKSVRRKHGIVRINFPTSEAKLRCLRHYLQCKDKEYISAAAAPKNVLLQELEDSEKKFRNSAGLDGVAHLALWKKIYQKLS